ncbi:hypothetical protein ACIGDI_40010 [Streptomyces sp. NPDC085900]|uniref:hypothetical protein n=1 Tax=Streptomyces sp. NPDC085900 TaxID=3365737 RepID=UPI0037CCE0D4
MTHQTPEQSPGRIVGASVPGPRVGDQARFASLGPDGIRLTDDPPQKHFVTPQWLSEKGMGTVDQPDPLQALLVRAVEQGGTAGAMGRTLSPTERDIAVDYIAAKVLVTRRSERWREAVSTALLGNWCEPLWQTGHLPATALGALKTEACTLHRQLVPVWERGTRHGRVLSLDADLGGGLSLYGLVAADVDYLAHTAGGVFEDERLNRVLRGLDPAERAVVFAYAEGEGTTWTEAAIVAGAPDPEAFGERVRRKVRRLAAEQRRRAAQCCPGPPAA